MIEFGRLISYTVASGGQGLALQLRREQVRGVDQRLFGDLDIHPALDPIVTRVGEGYAIRETWD